MDLHTRTPLKADWNAESNMEGEHFMLYCARCSKNPPTVRKVKNTIDSEMIDGIFSETQVPKFHGADTLDTITSYNIILRF